MAVQETHLGEVAWHSTKATALWELLGQPATKSVASHAKGGVAILLPATENAHHKHHFQREGAGFVVAG